MAVVNLNQSQAQASPYFWTFTSLTTRNSATVVKRRQKGHFISYEVADLTTALKRVNSYETYLSNAGVTVTQF